MIVVTSVESGGPRQHHSVVRDVRQSEIVRRVGVREDGQPVDRSRPPEFVGRGAHVIAVIVLVHLQYRQRRLVKRFVHLKRSTHTVLLLLVNIIYDSLVVYNST